MTHDFSSCLMDRVFYQSPIFSVGIAHQPMTRDFSSCLMDRVFYQSRVRSVVIAHQPMTRDFNSCPMDRVFYQSRVCSVVTAHQPMIHKQEQDGAWFSFPSISVFRKQLKKGFITLCCLHSILFSVSSWERGYIPYAVCLPSFSVSSWKRGL